MDLEKMMAAMGPMQEAMQKAAAERKATVIEGSAGGGAVTVELDGDLRLRSLRIAPSAAASVADDAGMLEDLIVAACNNALDIYKQRFGANPEEQLQKSMGGADLSGLMGLFGGPG